MDPLSKVYKILYPLSSADAGLDLPAVPAKTVGYGGINFYFQPLNNSVSYWTQCGRDTGWVRREPHGLITIQAQNGTALSTHRYSGKKIKTWPSWPNLMAFYANAGLSIPVIYYRDLNPLARFSQVHAYGIRIAGFGSNGIKDLRMDAYKNICSTERLREKINAGQNSSG
jgi:hypothetical protein